MGSKSAGPNATPQPSSTGQTNQATQPQTTTAQTQQPATNAPAQSSPSVSPYYNPFMGAPPAPPQAPRTQSTSNTTPTTNTSGTLTQQQTQTTQQPYQQPSGGWVDNFPSYPSTAPRGQPIGAIPYGQQPYQQQPYQQPSVYPYRPPSSTIIRGPNGETRGVADDFGSLPPGTPRGPAVGAIPYGQQPYQQQPYQQQQPYYPQQRAYPLDEGIGDGTPASTNSTPYNYPISDNFLDFTRWLGQTFGGDRNPPVVQDALRLAQTVTNQAPQTAAPPSAGPAQQQPNVTNNISQADIQSLLSQILGNYQQQFSFPSTLYGQPSYGAQQAPFSLPNPSLGTGTLNFPTSYNYNYNPFWSSRTALGYPQMSGQYPIDMSYLTQSRNPMNSPEVQDALRLARGLPVY